MTSSFRSLEFRYVRLFSTGALETVNPATILGLLTFLGIGKEYIYVSPDSSTSLRGQRTKGVWVLLAAVWFFILGLVGGFAAGLAAAITGAFFWWLFVERPRILTYSQGAFAGFFVQMVAYPVMYLLSGVLGLPGFVGNQPEFTYSGPILSGAEVVDILEGMVIAIGFHGSGIIITGPIGIAGGLILITLRRQFPPESER